ncbi:MAG: hypothetical protein QXG40_06510, partial [Ignisphaera sp.]
MTSSIDVRKITSYPPEIFPYAKPFDLLAGDNKVFEYTGLSARPPYIASLYSASFSAINGLNFRVAVDGVTDVVRIDDLGSTRGLDENEEFKVAAKDSMTAYIYSPSAISSYQFRYTIRVDKPNSLLKLLHGFPLDRRDEELIAKYDLKRLMATEPIEPYNPYIGIHRILTFAKALNISGTVLRLPVPSGMKAILLNIAMLRPTASGQALLTLERDRQGFNVFELDPYCLQGLVDNYPIRIVCLEEMLVELSVISGTHKVRLVVGLGKLTIPEKILWGIELTS